MTLTFFVDKVPSPFNIPYGFSVATLVIQFFLLKSGSYWSRMFSLEPLMNHCNQVKAESLIVTIKIKPESPRLINSFGIPSSFAIPLNKDVCLSK